MERVAVHPVSRFVTVDDTLEREFEARLVESSTLAFRVAFGVLRRREDAEDVAQDAFIKAHRSFAQLRDRDRFRAWLVRTTWRLAIDRQRSDRRRIARETTESRSESGQTQSDGTLGTLAGTAEAVPYAWAYPGPYADLEARERAAHLWAAIDALPEKLRLVIVLAGIEEQNISAVARLLDIPAGTVKSRLFLARQRLKEQLQWIR